MKLSLAILGVMLTGLAGANLVHMHRSLVVLISTAIYSSSAFPPFPPHPTFMHRMGPFGHGSWEESDEEDNESQVRAIQITDSNRDGCLAKLLCGMSVPVTGTGAPKDGYYVEYANIVSKFFNAFPMEDVSGESLELYDQYSFESFEDNVDQPEKTKPARLNSKRKEIQDIGTKKDSDGGLQLIDLAIVRTAGDNSSTSTPGTGISNEIAEEVKTRVARARKIIQNLGEKLETIKQCQQIPGCQYTFKELRNKVDGAVVKDSPIKSTGIKISNYQYHKNNSPNKAASFAAYKDPNRGDDELEEIFGPPPVFSPNGRPVNFNPQLSYPNHGYIPYNYGIGASGLTTEKQKDAENKKPVFTKPAFPNKKIVYKHPNLVTQPTGDNDEFDNVNVSTGPVMLIPEEKLTNPNGQSDKTQSAQVDASATVKETTQAEDDDDEYDYYDDDYDDDYDSYEDDEASASASEESVEENNSAEEEQRKETKNEIVTEKPKATLNYKNPKPSSFVFIEDEFSPKQPIVDDELEHPDNAWTKLSYAASGSLIKEPVFRNKSELEEKNDEKLNLSAASEEYESASRESDESYESDEEDEEPSVEQQTSQPSAKEAAHKPLRKPYDDEVEDAKKYRLKKKSRPKNRHHPKISINVEEDFGKLDSYWRKEMKSKEKQKPAHSKRPTHNYNYNRNNHSGKKSAPNKHNPPVSSISQSQSSEDSESEEADFSGPMVKSKKPSRRTPLLEIGGRPLVPSHSQGFSGTKNKKASALSRFNFNLVKPFGAPTVEEHQASSYFNSPFSKSSSSHQKKNERHSRPSVELPSFKNDLNKDYGHDYPAHTTGSSYLPSVSFGAGNGATGGGNVEFISGPPTTSPKPPSLIAFPFAAGLSSLANIFRRPGSSNKQAIPGPTEQRPAAVSSFMHRPVGPESNKFRRADMGSSSSGYKRRSKKHKKSGSYH